MLTLKSITNVIYPISELSILLLLPSIIISINKVSSKHKTILFLLLGYIFVDVLNFIISPIFIKKYHSNFPVLNLNLLTEAVVSLIILFLEFKERKTPMIIILFSLSIIILAFNIDLLNNNFSLFKSFRNFRVINSTITILISIYLTLITFNNLKLFKVKIHVIFLLSGLIIYQLTNLTYHFFIEYHLNNSITIQTAYLTFLVRCLINLSRNILLSIYAYRFS